MTEPARFDAIRTDRLLLRRWLESDRAPFAVLNADPETMRFFPQTLDRVASDALTARIEMGVSTSRATGCGRWRPPRPASSSASPGSTRCRTACPAPGRRGRLEARWHHGYATQGGQGRAHGGVRRHRPERDLVYDRCPQRAVPGRDAETGADRGRQVQPSRGASGSPGAAARDLPPVAVAGVVTGTAGG